jgi:hypothetical protein
MQWKNTETPSFAGSDGTAITGPDVVETMQLFDRNGAVVATFTKQVDGSFVFSAPATLSGTALEGAHTSGTVELAETYGDDGSHQTVAADLDLEAAAGTSEAGNTAFVAPAMFNLTGADLTKTNNLLAGLIAALSITGARATVLPLAAMLAILMDGCATADGIVTAHIDGGDPSTQTNARAAFAVSVFNNHASSGVEYGMDLHFTPSAEVDALLSGTAIGFTPSKAALRFPNGQWLVTLDSAITANSTETTAPSGSIGITSHATGVGKLFMSDGSKWQFAAVS